MNQLNLFLIKPELDVDKTMIGLGSRAINSQNDEESHQIALANAFLDLSTDQGDDPLVSSRMPELVDDYRSMLGKSNNMVSLETIVTKMDEMGIDFVEMMKQLSIC